MRSQFSLVLVFTLLLLSLFPGNSGEETIQISQTNPIDEYREGSSYMVDIEIVNDIGYIADGYNGLMIYNLSTLPEITLLSQLPIRGYTKFLDINGSYAVTYTDGFGVSLINISDPTEPILVSNQTTVGISSLYFDGTEIYTGNYNNVDIYTIQNNSITYANSFTTSGLIKDFLVAGDLLFLAEYTKGVSVYNATDRLNPILIDIVAVADRAHNLQKIGNYILVADTFNGGLSIIKYNDTLNFMGNLIIIQNTQTQIPQQMELNGTTLYMTTTRGGLFTINVTNPETPVILSSFQLTLSGQLDLWNNTAVVLMAQYGMALIDVTDPIGLNSIITVDPATDLYGDLVNTGEALAVSSFYDGVILFNDTKTTGMEIITKINYTTLGGRTINNVEYNNDILYISNGKKILVYNISIPSNPTEISIHYITGLIEGMELKDNILYTTSTYGLYTLNVTNPSNITTLGLYDKPQLSSVITVSDRYAFISKQFQNNLTIVDISDPTNMSLAATIITPRVNDAKIIGNKLIVSARNDKVTVYNISSDISILYTYNSIGFGRISTFEDLFGVITYDGILIGNISDYSKTNFLNIDIHYTIDFSVKSYFSITYDTIYFSNNNMGLQVYNYAINLPPTTSIASTSGTSTSTTSSTTSSIPTISSNSKTTTTSTTSSDSNSNTNISKTTIGDTSTTTVTEIKTGVSKANSLPFVSIFLVGGIMIATLIRKWKN